jgi:hypothetical protein
MPLPAPAWLSLLEAVQFVVEATCESEDRVREVLTGAGLMGTIIATGCRHLSSYKDSARYFAHPILDERETVPQEAWGTAICWSKSRVGMYDLIRLDRAEIERWLAAAATNWNEQPREETPPLRAEPRNPQSKERPRPKRDVVKRVLLKMFPNGLPSKDELPDYMLLKKCSSPDLKDTSPDTIVRAAADMREAQQSSEPLGGRLQK